MKIRRHSKIIELIETYDIGTQEELVARLKEEGFDITQATISRDIRDLKLFKIAGADGRPKYVVYSGAISDEQYSDKFLRVFRDGVLHMDYAQNMIVLKTMAGMAMAVGACIDVMHNEGILGCIAGDDTLLCVTKSEKEAISILARFQSFMEPSMS